MKNRTLFLSLLTLNLVASLAAHHDTTIVIEEDKQEKHHRHHWTLKKVAKKAALVAADLGVIALASISAHYNITLARGNFARKTSLLAVHTAIMGYALKDIYNQLR